MGSGAGAEAAIPTKSIPVTLEQLERVVGFNKMETESLKNTKAQLAGIYKEVMDQDTGVVDISSILVHPKGREILLRSSSYQLVDYATLILDAASQDGKFADR